MVGWADAVFVKVSEIEKKPNGHWWCVLTDGSGQTVAAKFLTQVSVPVTESVPASPPFRPTSMSMVAFYMSPVVNTSGPYL